jgi:hypothetical protein
MDVGSGKVLEVGVAGLRRQTEWRRVDLAGAARKVRQKDHRCLKLLGLGGSETNTQNVPDFKLEIWLGTKSWKRRLGQ